MPKVISGFLLFVISVLYACSLPLAAESKTLDHPGNAQAKIEYFVERPTVRGPRPMIVFLHGYQAPSESTGGRAFVEWGVLSSFAKRGYLAVSVSLPGYGASSGPADFAGPFTQQAVRTVIAKMEAEGEAIPGKVVIQGTSLGAVTAALIAADDPKLAGLVLISGLYDPEAFFAQPKTAVVAGIKAIAMAQVGQDAAGLKSRSALRVAARIRANTLILNGGDDDRTDPEQARQLAAAINASGGRASIHVYEGVGHMIPARLRESEIDTHIDSVLR